LLDDAAGLGDFSIRITSIALLAALALAGCATITKGTSQIVAIDTPGVPGSMCTITTQSGPQGVTTPGTITLAKGSSPLPISCMKECYLTGQSIIPSNVEAMAAGNVIFGGVIGLGVDAVSGAINKYPDMVTVAMTPDQSCRRAPAAALPPPPRRAAPKSKPKVQAPDSDQDPDQK
jgi:hypothetical protein